MEEHIGNFKRLINRFWGLKEIEPIEITYLVKTDKGNYKVTFDQTTGKVVREEKVKSE